MVEFLAMAIEEYQYSWNGKSIFIVLKTVLEILFSSIVIEKDFTRVSLVFVKQALYLLSHKSILWLGSNEKSN